MGFLDAGGVGAFLYNAGGIAWDAEQPGNRTPESGARSGQESERSGDSQ